MFLFAFSSPDRAGLKINRHTTLRKTEVGKPSATSFNIIDIIPGVRLHPTVKVVAISSNDAKDIRDMVINPPKAFK